MSAIAAAGGTSVPNGVAALRQQLELLQWFRRAGAVAIVYHEYAFCSAALFGNVCSLPCLLKSLSMGWSTA